MKKTIALLLALMLCVSTLAGCGGGGVGGSSGDSGDTADTAGVPPAATPAESQAPAQTASQATDSGQEVNASPDSGQEVNASQSPDPVLSGPSIETIKIESVEYGDISFSYLDDGSVSVETAGPGVDSLEAIEAAYEGYEVEVELRSTNDHVEFQKAHLRVDGVNIVIGYTNFNNENSAHRTFDAREYYRGNYIAGDVEYDGVKGYVYLYAIMTLCFPSISQYASRVVAIYPDVLPEDNFHNKDEWLPMLDLPGVKAILDTLEFSGASLDEPRHELMPVDDKYISFTPAGGWEAYGFSFSSTEYWLRREGADMRAGELAQPGILISIYSQRSPSEQMENELESSGAERAANLTINGTEYLVVTKQNFTYLITSIGGVLDQDQVGAVRITLMRFDDVELAMPFLETIAYK